ncbi:unnamed protein product [Blepharisma stoltei]|uniref:Uncharacterized protein n=1 Tax=Blepharisma stoltei TaxID=1481888 RepID=A0AAU9JQ13_9CILI|nr:unnamed protein product [Blepharisma stoltei]
MLEIDICNTIKSKLNNLSLMLIFHIKNNNKENLLVNLDIYFCILLLKMWNIFGNLYKKFTSPYTEA